MAAKDRPCLRGRHIMEVLLDGLHAKCDITDSLVAWRGIQDVIHTPEHTFVMVDSLQGYVIPKRLVTSGELASFAQEIDRFRSGLR